MNKGQMKFAVNDGESKALTPAQLVSIAVQQNADIEKLEKLMELQERWEAREAKRAYYEAISAFRAECPTIHKTRAVDFTTAKGRTNYSFAGLAETDESIRPILKKHGLTVTWRTHQTDGTVAVTCKLSHVKGHEEDTTLIGAPDTTGSKNALQAVGSTVTYLERYTMFALLGLAAKDDDGKGATERISDEQAKNIAALIDDVGADKSKLLKWLKVEAIEDIPADRYKDAVAAIERKRSK